MITVEQAIAIILEHTRTYSFQLVSLQNSLGRVLAEDILADRDFPPFNRATMDGIAISFQAYEQGQRIFPIQGIAAAGKPQQQVQAIEHCLEIMTGAMLPIGADTVVRYEDVTISEGKATINIETVSCHQDIHHKGKDRQQGEVIVKKGTLLTPAEIGIAATVGKPTLQVVKSPKTIIISSGDELVPIGYSPLQHQIRQSNNYAIQAILKSWGIDADVMHLLDDEKIIQEGLVTVFEQYELIIISGGVSEGKYDFIPKSLAMLGITNHFHKVAQKPGKPLWFGTTQTGKVVFALPGNPVSSFMCVYRYLQVWWRTSIGAPLLSVVATLEEAVDFRPPLTYFVQVRLYRDSNGKLFAKPLQGHGSGDFANLVDTDAFMELPKGKSRFEAGEVYPIWQYR